jgi:IS30 family transposase
MDVVEDRKMIKKNERGLAPEQCAEMWRRWKAGESLREIGAAIGRDSGTVHWHIKQRGGIAPAARVRSQRHLSLADREEISRGLVSGQSLSSIALQLGRPTSTISREVQRNGGRQAYRAAAAEQCAWTKAARPKTWRLASNGALRDVVSQMLQEDWAPQQIAGWLKREYENQPHMQVSHETIYRSLFVQAKSTLKKELLAQLRSKRQVRRTKTLKDYKQGQIVGAVSIRERPACVEDRAVPGHWEGDLIVGAKGSHVATLVERHSRYVMLAKLGGKDSRTVVDALIERVQELPSNLMRTLTWDRGTEMAQHARFTVATDVQVYFCDPRSPWQRGTNENTNGLLRYYLKRTDDLSVYTQEQLDEIARKLNTRPRETLGFKKPVEKLAASLALIG